MTTIGSLFTGYGGLDMGVAMVIDPDARVAWTCDVEPGPCRLAEVRWPGVPNLGDITKVDWTQVEPVDVICGGSPCQDLSTAGRRAGMSEGTRSALWESMLDAVDEIRPGLVVWENVEGALHASGDRSVGRAEEVLGTGSAEPVVRAAGRVAGDLAGIGYDAFWRVVPAASVGAPHRRARLFLIAYPAGQPWLVRGRADTGKTPFGRALSFARRRRRAPARELMPTPQATTATYSSAGYGANLHEVVSSQLGFGEYSKAIARWEWVLGRPAPTPAEMPLRGTKPRLSAAFVEWMMGLHAGNVTGEDLALTREQTLRLLGNGVVPLQAAVAVYQLLLAVEVMHA